MKSATLRTYIAVHTWVGLAAGFCLFIAFYAGSVILFHQELHAWETASSTVQPMQPVSQAQPLIDAVLKAYPQARQSFYLRLPSEYEPALSLDWTETVKQGKPVAHHFRLSPAGQLEDAEPYSKLVDFIFRLHYSAGLPPSWGIYVLGVICILYGMALASGVIIYAPSFLKDLFALRIGKNLKRMWQDAHNAIGILSLPFHLMYAWSSVILALGVILLAPFQYLIFDGKLLNLVGADISAVAPSRASGVAAPLLPASALLAAIQRAAPGMQVEGISYRHAGATNAEVQAYGAISRQTLTSKALVVLNASDGKLLRAMTPENFSPGTRFMRGLQTLHYAEYGDAALQWTYFVLGMGGAFLFYSGNLLWIEARRKRNRQVQPRSGRLMAQATLGVCLGCVAGVSAVFLLNKLAPGELPLWEQRGYHAVFFASVAWAFARPPARAAHELLILCAVLTAAIPLAQWQRSGVNPLLSLMRGDGVISGVALVSLLFAALYWKMARSVLHRGRHGDPHSVWSLQTITVEEGVKAL